jgi:hypothetical protein
LLQNRRRLQSWDKFFRRNMADFIRNVELQRIFSFLFLLMLFFGLDGSKVWKFFVKSLPTISIGAPLTSLLLVNLRDSSIELEHRFTCLIG